MATRKQKHAAAVAKHNSFMEDLRLSGLIAQRQDREQRTKELLEAQEKPHQKHNKFEEGCLHCDEIRRALARGEDIRPKSRRSSDKKVPRKHQTKGKAPARRTDERVEAEGRTSAEIEDRSSLEMECA